MDAPTLVVQRVMTMGECQWPHGYPLGKKCEEPVIAKVGLPSANALWVCQIGFALWQAQQKKAAEERAEAMRAKK